MNKAAVIDLGSNSIRMGIFEVTDGRIVQPERFRRQVRISEGIAKDECLQEEPMKRTLEAVGEFKEILDKKGISKIKMVATEALRRAKNSNVFTDKVKEEYGIDVEIIGGMEEARYDVIAAAESTGYQEFYMLDTGGGSLELAYVYGGEVIKACCLPLGSVVMTEKFRPDENGANDLERHITYEFIKSEVVYKKNIPIVALGGSNKELSKIHMKKEAEVDGYKMLVPDARRIYDSLKSVSLEERKSVEGLDKKRADTIVSGLCPLMVLSVLSDAKEITFSTGSVREGVAAEMLL